MLETGGSTFSRTAITIFVVLQVFAIKLLLQRFQDSGLIELPSWVPFFDKSNCGHQKAFEYVITSRNVITPDGIFPAAGEISASLFKLYAVLFNPTTQSRGQLSAGWIWVVSKALIVECVAARAMALF